MKKYSKNKWVIFDADNTLWDIEFLYDQAREEMCQYLAVYGYDIIEIEKYLRQRDTELHSTYGYSACRFARSFEDTVKEFTKDKCLDRDIIHVRKIALEVFEKKPLYNQELEKMFSSMKEKRYKLGLITAGERWVQEKRLSEFHLMDQIDEFLVVEKKDSEVIEKFINTHNLIREETWMVGDSPKSDVLPAIECGLNAVWLKNKNWSEHENEGYIEMLGDSYNEIKRLEELMDIVP